MCGTCDKNRKGCLFESVYSERNREKSISSQMENEYVWIFLDCSMDILLFISS